MSGLYSEKTGRTYDAVVVLDDTGGKYVNFKLEFPARKGGANERPTGKRTDTIRAGGNPKAGDEFVRQL